MSGPGQGDAAAEVDEGRRRDDGGGARARAEERRREEEEGEREKKALGRPIYKAVISGREIQGDHGVVISPSRRLDFRNDSKSKDPLRIWRSKKWT